MTKVLWESESANLYFLAQHASEATVFFPVCLRILASPFGRRTQVTVDCVARTSAAKSWIRAAKHGLYSDSGLFWLVGLNLEP